jgi:hypothetical protein
MHKCTGQIILKRVTNGQKTHEEMLNIPGHNGKVNQNDTEISFHYTQTIIKNTNNYKYWQECREKENLSHCW